MKITYYGTAAGEAWPGVFCQCHVCQEARRLGGKNIRTRSQALIDGALLLEASGGEGLVCLGQVEHVVVFLAAQAPAGP